MSKKFTLNGVEKTPGKWYYHLDTDASGETSAIDIESELRPSDFLKYVKLHQQISIWLEGVDAIKTLVKEQLPIPPSRTQSNDDPVKPFPNTKVCTDTKTTQTPPAMKRVRIKDARLLMEQLRELLQPVGIDTSLVDNFTWNPIGTTFKPSITLRELFIQLRWSYFLIRHSIEYVDTDKPYKSRIRQRYTRGVLKKFDSIWDMYPFLCTIEDVQLVDVDLKKLKLVFETAISEIHLKQKRVIASVSHLNGYPNEWMGIECPPLAVDWVALCNKIIENNPGDKLKATAEHLINNTLVSWKVTVARLTRELLKGSKGMLEYHPLFNNIHNSDQIMFFWYIIAKQQGIEIPLFV